MLYPAVFFQFYCIKILTFVTFGGFLYLSGFSKDHLKEMVKPTDYWAPPTELSSVSLLWGLRICISVTSQVVMLCP